MPQTEERTDELERLRAANRARHRGTKREAPQASDLLPPGVEYPLAVAVANGLAAEQLVEHATAAEQLAVAVRELRNSAAIDRHAINVALSIDEDPPPSRETALRRAHEVAAQREELTRHRAWGAMFRLYDAIADALEDGSWRQEQQQRVQAQFALLEEKREQLAGVERAIQIQNDLTRVEAHVLTMLDLAKDGPQIGSGTRAFARDHRDKRARG